MGLLWVCWFLGLALTFGDVYRFTVVVCGFWWLVVLRVGVVLFFLVFCVYGLV